MRKLNYTITTLEPLIITSHSDDPNMYETLQYIRGTVIQGLAAQLYLRKHKNADKAFNRLIIKGGCIFTNAFPVSENCKFFPAPFSLVKEKYNEGKVHNLLFNEIDVQTKGISNLVSIQEEKIKLLTLRKEVRLHNEIDDLKRTTSNGILFNYQSVPPGVVFEGQISINGTDEDFKLIKGLFSHGEFRIGRSSTAEYGLVRFEWIDDFVSEENIEESKNDAVEVIGSQAILTLISDTIVFNENGFSCLSLDSLSSYLKDATVLKSVSRRSRIEGFLNVWKLRKPSENVFAAGSSFLLNKMPANVKELQVNGIGERTQEGYGQVVITSVRDVYDEMKAEKFEWVNIKQETGGLPILTQSILKVSRLNRKKAGLIGQALKDANTTSRAPKNHLISKLKVLSQEPDTFSDNLRLLRDTAQTQLKAAYIGNQTLLQFLNKRIEKFDEICFLQEQVDENFIDFSDNATELKQIYFENYFNQLRRNKNKK